MESRFSLFLAELKRRKVVRVAVVYVIVGLGLLEGASMILPVLQLEAANPFIVILVLFGFPVALVLAWALEVTPDGIQRTAQVPPEEGAAAAAPTWSKTRWAFAAMGLAIVLSLGYVVFLSEPDPGPINRIAVLPPENLTGDPDQDYFVAGMHEQLIIVLGQVLGMEVDVLGRRSVLRFQSSDQTVPEIARELGVDAVVEASLTRTGDSAFVSARLTRAVAERQMWGDSYGGALQEISRVYRDVARDIASQVRAALSSQAAASAGQLRTIDPQAYDSYLRGRLYQNRLLNIEPDLYQAINHYRRSLERDSTFAPAYAGIAQAFAVLGAFNIISPDSAWPNMEAALERAVALEPQSAETQLALGVARYQQWRWDEARTALERTLELNPNDVDALHWGATFFSLMREKDRVLELVARAERLEPEDPWTMARLAAPLAGTGHYEEAKNKLLAVLEVWPDFGLGLWNLSTSLVYTGEFEEALQAMQSAMENMEADDLGDEYGATGHILGRLGKSEEARAQLQNQDRLEATGRYVSPVARAAVFVGIGEEERAFDLLDEGIETHAGWMVFVHNGPYFRSLHALPRMAEIRRAMDLPPLDQTRQKP